MYLSSDNKMDYKRFKFLQFEWPMLFKITQQVEANLTKEPDIALIKMRQLVEFTVKDVLEICTVQNVHQTLKK